MTTDVRPQIVTWAKWCVAHKDIFDYREIRPMPLTTKARIENDCSGTFTLCYYLAGAPDPNGLGYDGEGYTGTLVDHGQQIMQSQLEPGDAVIYFEDGVSVHVAMIIEPSSLTTMSHGQQSEPAYVTVSEDGRPHRFYRYATNSRFPQPAPKPPLAPAEGSPSVVQMTRAQMVGLKNVAQANQAVKNGWHLYYWSKDHFVVQVGGEPKAALYANKAWASKR